MGSQHRHGVLHRVVPQNVHLIITPSLSLKANGLFVALGQGSTPNLDCKNPERSGPFLPGQFHTLPFPLHNGHLPAWTPSA